MDTKAVNSEKGDLSQTSPKKQNPVKETSSESKSTRLPPSGFAQTIQNHTLS